MKFNKRIAIFSVICSFALTSCDFFKKLLPFLDHDPKIHLSTEEVELNLHENGVSDFKLSYTLENYETESTTAVGFISKNKEIATVGSNGKITAKSVGETQIVAFLREKSEIEAYCTVKVINQKPNITDVKLDKTAVTLDLNGKVNESLTATVLGEHGPSQTVVWKSADTSKVTVSGGELTAKWITTTPVKITATAPGTSFSATCNVTVNDTRPVTVTLDKTTAKCACTKTVQLTATVTPATKNQAVTWSTSTAGVTVSNNGLVSIPDDSTLVGTDVIVTATSVEDTTKSASCTITVDPKPEYPYDYTVMLYLCGSTLEYDSSHGGPVGCATADIVEILGASKANDNVRFLVETGGSERWTTSSSYLSGATSISNSKLQRWVVSGGKLELVETLSTNSMSTQSSFESFLKWGLKDYSAKQMGVILWDHGAGIGGVCADSNSYYDDTLTAPEVVKASKNALAAYDRDKFTWIGYDACLMACADIASVNADYYEYMIASQETEPGNGWAYDQWVPLIYNDSKVTTSTLFNKMVSSYNAQRYYAASYSTLSVFDLSKSAAFVSAFEDYAKQVKTSVTSKSTFTSYIATPYLESLLFGEAEEGALFGLADFTDYLKTASTYLPSISYTNVVSAINDMVIYNGYSNRYTTHPCGMNIFVGAIRDDSGKNYPLQAPESDYRDTNGTKLTTWRTLNLSYSSCNWL